MGKLEDDAVRRLHELVAHRKTLLEEAAAIDIEISTLNFMLPQEQRVPVIVPLTRIRPTLPDALLALVLRNPGITPQHVTEELLTAYPKVAPSSVKSEISRAITQRKEITRVTTRGFPQLFAVLTRAGRD